MSGSGQIAYTETLTAPAKVNLSLRVHGRRSDGFHELTSLVVAIDLCDMLRLAPGSPGEIRLECDPPGLPVGDENLVVRAARLLAGRLGAEGGAQIRLEKAIPVAAGLGGGSSDAAAALKGLRRLWRADVSDAALAEMGAEIGSDVPLFFHLPAAVIRGRGERVERVALGWSGWVGLVFSGEVVSTPAVYAALACSPGVRVAEDGGVQAIARCTTAEAIGPHLVNDLERGVFRVCPAMERLLGRVQDAGGRPARISGAGSVVYSLFDEAREATAWVETMRTRQLGTGATAVRAPVPQA
ncbi:MAG: 4-(cytidine 5'-diphospho)-2-C-methyl-D-erythritol kinase [Phycisphaerae bacterium]|nr:4-(cytidine 5'-diphospho)-2-C-methyl-D-erythritol kinase [Phycisphaerae bacterium]